MEESRPSCPLRSAEILGPQNASVASSKLRKFKLNSSQISHDFSKIVMEQLTGNYMKWNYCKYKLENFTPNSLKLIKTFIIQNHQNYKETRKSTWCGVWSIDHKLWVLKHKKPVHVRKNIVDFVKLKVSTKKGTDFLKKKNAQPESCKSNFIWGKMRTAAQEPAPQVSLRNCSKEGWGEAGKGVSVYICDLDEGETRAIRHIFSQTCGFC